MQQDFDTSHRIIQKITAMQEEDRARKERLGQQKPVERGSSESELQPEQPSRGVVIEGRESVGNFYIPELYESAGRDTRCVMDVAVFRLSKRHVRRGEVMSFKVSDGQVDVSSGAYGMASIWDYDLILMAISHLTESVNRHRAGRGDLPGRIFKPSIQDILRFCGRPNGGRQTADLLLTCKRLNTTHVAVLRGSVHEGENLIASYEVIKNQKGEAVSLEIEIAKFIYREVVEGKKPEVLQMHPDYFKLSDGIGRFVYRLARQSAGKGSASWLFKTIYDRSGSTGDLKKFTYTLRAMIKDARLPEYELSEERGMAGPMLVMRFTGSD